MHKEELTLDELATALNVSPRTIRYYQTEGYIPLPRIEGRRAVYSPEHLERLRQIVSQRGARKLLDICATAPTEAGGDVLLPGAINSIGYEEFFKFSLRDGVELVVSPTRAGLDLEGAKRLSTKIADLLRRMEGRTMASIEFQQEDPAGTKRLLETLMKAGLDDEAFRLIHPKRGETIERHLNYVGTKQKFQAESTNIYVNQRLQLCEKFLREAQRSGGLIDWMELAKNAADAVPIFVRKS